MVNFKCLGLRLLLDKLNHLKASGNYECKTIKSLIKTIKIIFICSPTLQEHIEEYRVLKLKILHVGNVLDF